MTTITVDPTVYEAASEVFGADLANVVKAAENGLETALRATTRMAGSDPAGAAFSTQYDQAAQQLVQALDDLRRASITVGGLLQQSGFNHGRAEAHSDASGGTALPPDTTQYQPGGGACMAVPSAAGGSIPAPSGWGAVASACGAIWPDGDPGRLRAAANAWRAAASTLDSGQQLVSRGITTISSQVSPEIPAAKTICGQLGQEITAVSKQARAIATACDDLAQHIDDAHQQLIDEVIQFVAISAAIEVGGAILGAVTFGIGEAAAQAGEAGEIAAAIARILEIIEDLGNAVRAVVGRFTAGALEAGGDALKVILGKVPALAETDSVAGGVKALEETADELESQAASGAERHPDYPNRTPDGKYAGRDALSVDKEQQGLDQYAKENGVDVVNTKVRATVEGGRASGRYYDGLVRIGQTDDYVAVEVKSGSAIDRYVGSDQEAFDKLVTPDNPANAVLDGKPIRILRVERQDVP